MNDDIQMYVADAVNAVEFKMGKLWPSSPKQLRINPQLFPVRDKEDIDDESLAFQPDMAHQVFGENEKIFGYKNLKVMLYYNAGSLNVYFDIKYSNKLESEKHKNVKPDDVSSLITDKLPMGCYITNLDEFLSTVEKDEKFQPLGEKISEYEIMTGEIWNLYDEYKNYRRKASKCLLCNRIQFDIVF